jgi:hypothetical protein
MKYIIAYQRSMAEAAARELNLGPREWAYLSGARRLRGIYGGEFIRVITPRYEPSGMELDNLNEIEQMLARMSNPTVSNHRLP